MAGGGISTTGSLLLPASQREQRQSQEHRCTFRIALEWLFSSSSPYLAILTRFNLPFSKTFAKKGSRANRMLLLAAATVSVHMLNVLRNVAFMTLTCGALGASLSFLVKGPQDCALLVPSRDCWISHTVGGVFKSPETSNA